MINLSVLEDLGDSTIKILQQILFQLLGLIIKIVKIGRDLKDRLEKIEKEKIFPTFAKKNIEFKDYIILKLQISSLLFLLLSVIYIFNFLGQRKFLLLAIAPGIYSVYLIFYNIKEHFEKDFNAYRDFFLAYMGIAVILIVIKKIKPSINYIFPYFHLILVSLAGVVAISVVFKKKYGRNFTIGLVIEGGSLVKIRVNYDICASIKPSIETFENTVKAKEGDLVKLRVEKSFLNLRGSMATEIIGVVDG